MIKKVVGLVLCVAMLATCSGCVFRGSSSTVDTSTKFEKGFFTENEYFNESAELMCRLDGGFFIDPDSAKNANFDFEKDYDIDPNAKIETVGVFPTGGFIMFYNEEISMFANMDTMVRKELDEIEEDNNDSKDVKYDAKKGSSKKIADKEYCTIDIKASQGIKDLSVKMYLRIIGDYLYTIFVTAATDTDVDEIIDSIQKIDTKNLSEKKTAARNYENEFAHDAEKLKEKLNKYDKYDKNNNSSDLDDLEKRLDDINKKLDNDKSLDKHDDLSNDTLSETYIKGETVGNDYTNASAKFKYTSPSGVKKQNTVPNSEFEVATSDKTGVLCIISEDWPLPLSNYISSFVEQIQQEEPSLKKEDESSEELAGQEWNVVLFKATISGQNLHQKYYFRKVGNSVIAILVEYLDSKKSSYDKIISGFSAY